MKLLLLFLCLLDFYPNIESISIFVKISWRDNGEHELDYYKYLVNKKSERFLLGLTNNSIQQSIVRVTDGYDTYHFKQKDFQSVGIELSNFYLLVALNGHDLIIGKIENIEDNSIIYIIPRLDNTKYIKVTKDIVNDYFEQMINLFKHPVRILQFIWNRPMKSNNPIDVRIGCKNEVIKNQATTHYISSLNTMMYRKGIPYQSTYYVRSKVCPSDQYSVMLLGTHVNEWLNCDQAIFSHNFVNTYYINFYDPPNKPYCKLRASPLEIADVFEDKLSDIVKDVDQFMKFIFADSEGIAIQGGNFSIDKRDRFEILLINKGWIGDKSVFQILSSNNTNEMEGGQRREHALGKPPKYPKSNLMVRQPAMMPYSTFHFPGENSTLGLGSTMEKIDVDNLPAPHDLVFNNQIKLYENALMWAKIKQMQNIGRNAHGINIASQNINEQIHQRSHQQNINLLPQQHVLENVPQIASGAHASVKPDKGKRIVDSNSEQPRKKARNAYQNPRNGIVIGNGDVSGSEAMNSQHLQGNSERNKGDDDDFIQKMIDELY